MEAISTISSKKKLVSSPHYKPPQDKPDLPQRPVPGPCSTAPLRAASCQDSSWRLAQTQHLQQHSPPRTTNGHDSSHSTAAPSAGSEKKSACSPVPNFLKLPATKTQALFMPLPSPPRVHCTQSGFSTKISYRTSPCGIDCRTAVLTLGFFEGCSSPRARF